VALPRIFDRLIGLETEYGIRFSPSREDAPAPAKSQLVKALLDRIKKRLPCAPAISFKDGIFTANGGAFWLEQAALDAEVGLIEGSTPECRTPRELLTYSRAQDRLLKEVSQELSFDGQVTLLKNDRDAADNIYGAQENYEADIAIGWRILVWRTGLIAILPLVALTWLLLAFYVVVVLAVLLIGGPVYLLAVTAMSARRKERATAALHRWLIFLSSCCERCITFPAAGGLYVLTRLVAFRPQRRELLPLLISRAVLAGAGMVDRRGQFHLADKGPSINCLVGFGGLVGDRPVYSMGHLLKPLIYHVWRSPGDFSRLFRRRQRLQIAIGDSNMAEEAELLRVGTTLLVLDAIEAGFIRRTPRLRRPLRSLRHICADPLLTARVRLSGGRHWTALEIQQFYLSRCRNMLESTPDAPTEAWDILYRWEDVLATFERDPRELVGRIDWVTKKFLLDQLGPAASWEARKKLDLRYHELSAEGYFERLKTTEMAVAHVDPAEIELAMQTPPPDSPAALRGRLIRENAGRTVTVNWDIVRIYSGWRAKEIPLNPTAAGR